MNKFKKILMLGYTKDDLGEIEWKRLKLLSESVIILPKDSLEIDANLADCDCLLVKLGATVDKQIIDAAPKLKYIGMLGTGYGRVNAVYGAKKGITVCNIAGYSREGVAELVFGILIENLREIGRAKSQAANGDYSEETYVGTEIKNKIFGIIGLGSIGGRIAEIAKNGFGANVCYWSKHRKKDAEKAGVKFENINRLLETSDFLSLNLSYVPQTKGFFDKQKIELIKSDAIVLNLSPMELVDIPALQNRLEKGDITFILDHSDELSPQQVKQLSKYKKCIMYPAIGYVTNEATTAKKVMFIDNIENFLKGRPSNKVN